MPATKKRAAASSQKRPDKIELLVERNRKLFARIEQERKKNAAREALEWKEIARLAKQMETLLRQS